MNRHRRRYGDTSCEIKRVDDNRFSALSIVTKFDRRSNMSSKITLLTGESPRKLQGELIVSQPNLEITQIAQGVISLKILFFPS